MVYKVVIKNPKSSPVRYLPDLENFRKGKGFIFKPGVNIIVGENGCGKTTLLKLIQAYLMVGDTECDKGIYSSNVHKLFEGIDKGKKFFSGVDVYADYDKNTFRLCHANERDNDQVMSSFENFGTFFDMRHASTGEGVNIALNSLFGYIFSKKVKLKYDYSQFKEDYPAYLRYIDKHKDSSIDEWTILMDEPDRNLDIENIAQIKGILSFHKPQTQIIAVVHNPLLIYSLSKNKDINFIEMTEGYIHKINQLVRDLVR